MLKFLVNQQNRVLSNYKQFMYEQYDKLEVSFLTEESVYRNLTNRFPTERDRKKYASCVLVDRTEDGSYRLTAAFNKLLTHREFKSMVCSLLALGENRCRENYSKLYRNTCFQLYQKYTYEDVCRLLGWKQNLNAQNIGGYSYDRDTKTIPVFINYNKPEDAIPYEDIFLSESSLIAFSKHPRQINSSDAKHIYKQTPEDRDNRIFLFVRKNKDDKEAKEFYFLGEIFAEGTPEHVHLEATNDDAFKIVYRLDVPVRSDIYDYIVSD